MRARIERLVDAFLDSMEEAGPPADLVTKLALPLPLAVICELLGIPQADRGRFRAWSDVFMSTTRYPVEEVREAQAHFERYFAALITHKRAHPYQRSIQLIATTAGFPKRIGSISPAPTRHTSRSASAPTTVSAPSSLALSCR
jgi:cytochrome P450